MMNELIESVAKLAEEEYQRASAKFGPKNNSPHESYAVLLEETEEAQEQVSVIQSRMEAFWLTVKGDATDAMGVYLNSIKMAAILGACELIQVAAMADKALMGYEKKEDDDNA